jgi:carboxymethylenebutenolidase
VSRAELRSEVAADGREITLEARGGAPATPAFAIVPPGAKRGVVVIHEIFGRQPEIDRVVSRFARAGYAAVAPDLFHRGRVACLVDVFLRAMKSGEGVAVEQGRNARAWLAAEAGLPPERIGLVGFCFGGGYALAAGAGWGAVSTNYGLIPATEVMRGIGPVIGCYGGRDKNFRDKGKELEAKLAKVGVTPEVHVFPDAGHSFLTDGDHPVGRMLFRSMALGDYPDAREEGWKHIFAFLDRALAT